MAALHDVLSPRQAQVLALHGRGMTQQQIALQLGVADSTVRGHVSAALKRTKAPSAALACVAWQRERLLAPEAVHAAVLAARATPGALDERMRVAITAALDCTPLITALVPEEQS